MKKGDVWRVRFPAAPGHVQSGERPAVIVQNDRFTAKLPTVLVVPLTGTLRSSRFPATVVVQPDANNGLTRRPWPWSFR